MVRTERLILREFIESDAQAFFLIMSDQEANTFLPWFPLQSLEEAEAYLREKVLDKDRKSGYFCAVCLREDNVPIGYLHLSQEDSHDFGYALRKEFWHKGITTEAALAFTERVRQAGIPYITATHDVSNPRSGEVMKKIGMVYRNSYEEQWQPKDFPVTFRMY